MRLEGSWGPIKGPGVNMIHVIGLSAREDTMVDEVRESLKGKFPGVESVAVFGRDVGANLRWEEEWEDGEKVVERWQGDGRRSVRSKGGIQEGPTQGFGNPIERDLL